MSRYFSRRRFMQHLGLGAAAGLVSPLISRVYAQTAGTPKRFVFLMQGNGIETHNFKPPGLPASSTLETPHIGAALDGPAFAALQGGPGELDLRPHAVALLGLSSKISGGSHTTQYKALTCSLERRQTFDSFLSETLYQDQTFKALRFGVTESSAAQLQYNICYRGPQTALPIIVNPADAHGYLFGSISSGTGGKAFATQGDLLDFAYQDTTRALNVFGGSTRERAKLENYLLALEDLRNEQIRLLESAEDLQLLAIQEAIDPDDGDAMNSSHPTERLRSQFDLATAALLGGLTDVVVLTNSVGNAFSHTKYTSERFAPLFGMDPNFDGVVPWRHGVCHGQANSVSYQAVLDEVITVQVELVARLARRLAAIPEGEGSMLDHTAIVLMSDNGDTHHSQAGNWPTLLVGGSAMGLQTGGRTILYPQVGHANNRRMSNLFNTLAYAAGVPMDDFGGEPDKGDFPGPLSELWA